MRQRLRGGAFHCRPRASRPQANPSLGEGRAHGAGKARSPFFCTTTRSKRIARTSAALLLLAAALLGLFGTLQLPASNEAAAAGYNTGKVSSLDELKIGEAYEFMPVWDACKDAGYASEAKPVGTGWTTGNMHARLDGGDTAAWVLSQNDKVKDGDTSQYVAVTNIGYWNGKRVDLRVSPKTIAVQKDGSAGVAKISRYYNQGKTALDSMNNWVVWNYSFYYNGTETPVSDLKSHLYFYCLTHLSGASTTEVVCVARSTSDPLVTATYEGDLIESVNAAGELYYTPRTDQTASAGTLVCTYEGSSYDFTTSWETLLEVANGKDPAVSDYVVKQSFYFTKTDESGAALPGATFQLTQGSTVIGTATSDSNGLVNFGVLSAPGTYTLTETSAPSGYTRHTGSWTVTVTGDDTAIPPTWSASVKTASGSVGFSGSAVGSYKLADYPTVPFKFTKTDTAGTALSGATFGLYSSTSMTSSTLLKSVTSTSTGLVDFGNLDAGTYYLKETSAPSGCVASSGYWKVTVTSTSSGKNVSLASYSSAKAFTGSYSAGYKLANNMESVTFSFTKTNASGKALFGATFGLYSSTPFTSSTLLKSVTSTSAGLVDFGNLDAGTYYLKETSAPSGYTASSGYWKVVVTSGASGKGVSLTSLSSATAFTGSYAAGYKLKNSEEPVAFSFTKTNESGTALSGATFGLYSSTTFTSSTLLKSVTSTTAGLVNFGNLDAGTYYLKEISAPSGYAMSSGYWKVVVTFGTSGKGVTLTAVDSATAFTGNQTDGWKLANTLKKLPFSFTKTDADTGAGLSGATFGLYSSTTMDASTLVKSVVSASGTGLVDFGELDAGTYYLAETSAPAGYEKASGYWKVEANTDDACTVTVAALGGAPSFTGSYASGWKLFNEVVPVAFSFTKTDRAGTALAGATFELSSSPAGTYNKSVTSGANGAVDFGELKPGTYTLVETAAPADYEKIEGSWTLVVDAAASTVSIASVDGARTFSGSYATGYKLVNLKEGEGTVPFSFTKTAEDGATALAGATFELYACGDTTHTSAADHSWTATTDADCCWKVDEPVATVTSAAGTGLVDFGELEGGQYMLVETAAPSGYRLPHGQWLVDVDASAQTVTISAHAAKDAAGNVTGDLPPAFKKDAGTGAYLLPNYKEWVMPLAGGTGPIALTATGAALIAAALSWLLLARRKQRTT